MKRIENIIVLLVLVMLLGACKDDDSSTNPSDESLSFPLAEGNYWMYEVYEIDANESKVGEKTGTNKMIIGKAVTIDGRAGFGFSEESTSVDEDEEDEVNFTAISSDDEGLYIYFSNLTEEEGNPLEGLTPGWTKLIDFKNQTWEALNFPIDEKTDTTALVGFFKMIGSKVGNVEVSYKGKTYDAVKFKTTTILDLAFTADEVTIDFEGEEDSYYVLISGVGIFETKSIETDEETELKGGTIDILVDHNLN